ncbi:hypothetical protein T492DRAFT_875193, partial [Pavlovales sp. CCMP2436]
DGRLLVAYGAAAGEAAAIAVTLGVLAALFEPTDTGAAGTGAVGTGAADAGAAVTGAADTGAADTGAADTGATDTGAADTGLLDALRLSAFPWPSRPVDKAVLSERLVYLQAACSGQAASQMPLPRPLAKQLNRFFMSPKRLLE